MTPAPPVQDVLTKIRACTLCKGLPLGHNPILQASAGSKVLIVGQAPGRTTHAKGRPFDDPSGDRLRRWLGVERARFYDPQTFAIVPMGFCFPGTGASGDLPPRPECAATWRQHVLDMLKCVELTLIIGRYAIDCHQPEFASSSVTKAVRGWRMRWPHQAVLPHPSPRNNRWLKMNPWFETEVIPNLQARVHQITNRSPAISLTERAKDTSHR